MNKRITIAGSGGGGRGVGLQLGAIQVLHKYLSDSGDRIVSWKGTSAGAVVGGVYCQNPSDDGINAAINRYLNDGPEKIFGKNYKTKLFWNSFWLFQKTALKILFGSNSPFDSNIDAFIDRDPYMNYLGSIFGSHKLSEFSVDLTVNGYDINTSQLIAFRENAYAFVSIYLSSAEPPFLPPYNRTIDGGLFLNLPLEQALADQNDEIYLFLTSTSLKPNDNLKGVFNILRATVDSCVVENIRRSLKLIEQPNGTVKIHFIDLSAIGFNEDNSFIDFFEHRNEYLQKGREIMTSYLNNPSPTFTNYRN